MHPDDVTLLRFRHGEAGAVVTARIREHLAQCDECRGRVQRSEREDEQFDGLLQSLDSAPPRVDLRSVVAGARARRRPVHRRAAVIAFLLGGAAMAWALPGSPLRGWVSRGSSENDVAAIPNPPADVERSGITLPPGDRLTIAFAADQTDGTVTISLVDDAEAAVSAPVGAATFTSNGQRLEIGNRNAVASFEIRIPKAAPRVDVQVGERVIWSRTGDETTTGVSPDAGGRWVIPFGRG